MFIISLCFLAIKCLNNAMSSPKEPKICKNKYKKINNKYIIL